LPALLRPRIDTFLAFPLAISRLRPYSGKTARRMSRRSSLIILPCLLLACRNVPDKKENHVEREPAPVQSHPHRIPPPPEETSVRVEVTLVAEQDPEGVFWGLRDTVTGKLVSDYTYQKIWDFKNGFATVIRDGKFGMVNKSGKEIIEPVYDYPESDMKCGFTAFEHGYGPVIIFNDSGRAIMPSISGLISFLPCRQRVSFGTNRCGVMNFKGETVIPFKFRSAALLPEGYCIASDYDNMYGLYDLDGNEVLPHAFQRIDGFYSGRAIVKKRGKLGVIDLTGRELFYTAYGRIDRYSNGYAVVYTDGKKGEPKIGIIDRNGREAVPSVYQWLERSNTFFEGLAVMAQNFKYGFIDTNGKVAIQFKYVNAESFQNGIAKVWTGWHNVGYIDRTGKDVILPVFEPMGQDNLRRYHNKFIIGWRDSAMHVFEYSGREIATLPYDMIRELDEKSKSFIVKKNHKTGTLDSNLRVVIPVVYQALELIFPGKFAAWKNGKIGFIDPGGKILSPFEYDEIRPFQDDFVNSYANHLAIVVKNGKLGLINSYGALIVAVKYDEIEHFSHGLAVVKRNDRYGFVNSKGKEIIKTIYESAKAFDGYRAEVTLKGETFQVDGSGKRVEEEEEEDY
jgi:hypothetical protein